MGDLCFLRTSGRFVQIIDRWFVIVPSPLPVGFVSKGDQNV